MKPYRVVWVPFFLLPLLWGGMAMADGESTGQPELSQIVFFVR